MVAMPPHGRAAAYAHGESEVAAQQACSVCREFLMRKLNPSSRLSVYLDVTELGAFSDAGDLERMLTDADVGRFEWLATLCLDRLGRDPVELTRRLERLDAAGVIVVAINDGFCSDAALTPVFFPQLNKES